VNTRVLLVIRRRWPILVVIPLLAAAAGTFFVPTAQAQPELRFSADALIAVDDNVVSQTAMAQAALEADQGAVAVAVAENSGLSTADVARRVTGTFDWETFVITLEAFGPTEAEAEQLARTVSTAFTDAANQRPVLERESVMAEAVAERNAALSELTAFLEANRAAFSSEQVPPDIQAQRDALEAESVAAAVRVESVEATPVSDEVYRLVNVTPGSRSSTDQLALPASVPLRVTMGLIFGLAGAILLTLGLERLNPRIDAPEQATELIGAPVLAMVPVMNRKHRAVVERADPDRFRGPFAEAFRSMRSHLEFRAQAEGLEAPPRVMVTSATPGEGKSTTTAFLALSYAETERPPIIIGADLRRPMVHKLFEVERMPGLSSRALAGGDIVALDEIVKQDWTTGVSVVASGPAIDRVTGLLGDLKALAEAGQSSGRVVLIDTPPVMVANDAIDFLVAVDWVVVVLRVGRSTQRSVKQMVETLRLNEATIAGIVMVGSLEASDAKRYYYSYYADDASDRKAVARSAPIDEGGDRPVRVSGTVDHPHTGAPPVAEADKAPVSADPPQGRRWRRRSPQRQ
jgi:Mrp family chromosome partitioning ATPase/capsular polysaccharide biosynthesis protein